MTLREIEAEAARLHGQLMNRSRPLWEFHVFERVVAPEGWPATGRLVAFYSKIHHAALDGQGGTVLANAILDISAIARDVPPPDANASTRRRAGSPRMGQMISAVFSNSLAQYVKLTRALPSAARAVRGVVAQRVGAAGSPSRLPMQLAPRTIFNVGVGAERSFCTATFALDRARALAKAAGGSFNDIVLWVCATALRHYLREHSSLPRKSLVAAMPVSLRSGDDKTLNNQASMTLVQLGTHLADPHKRMQAIMQSTGKVKQALSGLKSLLPTDYPSLLAPWVVGGAARAALKIYGRAGVAERLPAVANLIISNVPGPQMPLYLAGARMLSFHPVSIVMHGLALNITVQTYAGRVDFGLVAGRAAAPQLQALADAIERAFDEAVAVFTVSAQTAAAEVTAHRATPRRRAASLARKAPPAKRGTNSPSRVRVA